MGAPSEAEKYPLLGRDELESVPSLLLNQATTTCGLWLNPAPSQPSFPALISLAPGLALSLRLPASPHPGPGPSKL